VRKSEALSLRWELVASSVGGGGEGEREGGRGCVCLFVGVVLRRRVLVRG
jgi:hypothetical protein